MVESKQRRFPFVLGAVEALLEGGPPFPIGTELTAPRPFGLVAVITKPLEACFSSRKKGRSVFVTTEPGSVRDRSGIDRVLPPNTEFTLHPKRKRR